MSDDPNTPNPSTETTFSQEQVNAVATKAAKEAERKARQAAQTEMADTLGVSVEEAKRLIEAAKAAEEANATELDKARRAQAEAEAKAAKAEAEAEAIRARASATTALVAAGVQATVIDDALRLIDTGADDLSAEIEALKGRLPALFDARADGTPPPPPSVNPPRQPGGGGNTTPEDRAKARRERMFPNRKSAA